MGKKDITKTKKSEVNLTPLQELFCLELFNCDFNASKAALNAGYSPRSAAKQATQLLANPRIQAKIQELFNNLYQKKAEQIGLTVEEVLTSLKNIADSNITDVLDVIGGQVCIFDTADIPPEKIGSISEIKQTKDGAISVKMYDKLKAMELAGRYLKLWTDRVESTNLHHHTGQLSIDISIYNNKEVIDLKADLDQLQQELAASEAALKALEEAPEPDV